MNWKCWSHCKTLMQHLCFRMCYCLFVCDVQDSELDVAFQATFSKISPFIPANKARPHFTRLTAMWLHASFKTGLTHGHWSPRWMGKRSTFKLLMSSGDTRVLILRSVIRGDHTLTQSVGLTGSSAMQPCHSNFCTNNGRNSTVFVWLRTDPWTSLGPTAASLTLRMKLVLTQTAGVKFTHRLKKSKSHSAIVPSVYPQ